MRYQTATAEYLKRNLSIDKLGGLYTTAAQETLKGIIDIDKLGGLYTTAAQEALKNIWELYAPFNVTDRTFSNGDVLEIESGVQSGSLIVVKTGSNGNSVEVVDGELEIVGSGSWGTTGVVSQAIVRDFGVGLFNTIEQTIATQTSAFAWKESQDVDLATVGGDKWGLFVSSNDFKVAVESVVSQTVGVAVGATDYQSLIVLGGYDINGIPWKVGDNPADFLYGASFWIKGGTFSAWTLLWKDPAQNTATMYASFGSSTATTMFDKILIPTNPLSPSIMFQPKYLSTFTGTNGTQIVAYDPEVGGRLESGGVTWTIQDDKAVNDPGLTNVYTSDFSGGVDGWNGLRGTVEGDVDIGEDGGGIPPTYNDNLRFTIDTENNSHQARKLALLTVGKTTRIRMDYYIPSTNSHLDGISIFAGSGNLGNEITLDAWTSVDEYIQVVGTVNLVVFGLDGGSTTINDAAGDDVFYIRNVIIDELTINEIFATDDLGITQGIFDVPITIPTVNDGFAGLVLALNSVNSPTDYIEVFYNRGTGKVEVTKFVAGSPTSLMNETTAYGGAGKQLRAILTYISATDDLKLRVYYNGALVGTEQTIEDNGIAGNTRHGIMSVDASNTIGSLVVHSLNDLDWDAEISRATGGTY